MSERETKSSSDRFEEVQEIFLNWRRVRKKGRHIPEDLWDLAVQLCKDHSVCKVHRALNLDYNILKKRVSGKTLERKVKDKDVLSSFVKVAVKEDVTGNFDRPSSAYALEFIRPDGYHLKVLTHEQSSLDSLCKLFLKQP